jgi:hypothetical protein
MNIRNIPYIRTIPVWGERVAEAFSDIQQAIRNVSQQANLNPAGTDQAPPPQINALKVVVNGGVAHVQITDNNQIYRGINYHVQYGTDQGLSAPVTHHMGPSRDARIPVGIQPLWWRAYSDYPTSSPSAPVYHPMTTSTGTNPPPVPPGQGSGTGTPGQISGFGIIPFRGTNPPKRQ